MLGTMVKLSFIPLWALLLTPTRAKADVEDLSRLWNVLNPSSVMPDNELHQLTLDNLKTLRLEIIPKRTICLSNKVDNRSTN